MSEGRLSDILLGVAFGFGLIVLFVSMTAIVGGIAFVVAWLRRRLEARREDDGKGD